MSIEKEIADWDGKSADTIKQIYESYHNQPNFSDELVRIVNDVNFQKGITWLLKAYVESGNQLKREQIKVIYCLLHKLEHWETKLHILQCLPFMPVGITEKEKVENFLRITLTDSNKFVRAWTYNGFYELAMQYPEYQEEAKQFFEMAMRDEAASIKARLRNIMKKGF